MTKKAISVTAMVIAALLILWWGFGGNGQPGQQGGPGGGGFGNMFGGAGGSGGAVTVEAGDIARIALTDVSEYTGSLQSRHEFTVAARVSGRVHELLVDIGDEVTRGQVIARLDDAEFIQQSEEARAALEVAQAQLSDARARVEVRQREFERLQRVREQGLVSEAEYDVSRAEYTAAQANVEVAQAQVVQRQAAYSAAQIRQSYATVRAEWSGADDTSPRVVGERFINEGATVSANEPIVSVLDNGALRAVTFVSDRDFARLRVGQPVEVTTDVWPGERFEGLIERIAPRLDEDSRQVRVEARIPNDDGRLSPGFFVNLRIEVETLEDAQVVPIEALARLGGQQGVYVIDEEEMVARFQPATIGVRTRELAQIIEPTLTGRVVTLGQHLLSDVTPVRIAGEQEGGGQQAHRMEGVVPNRNGERSEP